MKKEVSMTASQPLEMGQLEEILQAYRGQKGAVIPVLQKAQKIYGYLPEEVLQRIARGLRVPISRIYGVATFYSQFYLTRRGRHVVRQCDGTACHVRGSGQIIEKIEKELGVKAGDTTPDYKVTYEVVYCLGSCGLAPVATVDGAAVGKLAPERMTALVQKLE
jgi:NADH-quinone oxidoreductase subunit E